MVTEEKENNVQEEVKEDTPVKLGQVPTQYGLVFSTPEGNLSQEEYLVWIGNKLVGLEQAIKG